jgi:hypothetical protein
MAIGNDPSSSTSTTNKNEGAGATAGAQGDVFGVQTSGYVGNITTSDFGAIKAGEDIALSGLQSSLAQSTKAADTIQKALNTTAALGSQTASGGLTTVLVPALWIAGGVAAIWFISKAMKKGS